MDPLDGSFFEDLLDESSWGRFGVADPALPEYLGGTVILLGKMRTWCVKWGMASRAVGSCPSRAGIPWFPIFKSLHNYHYGTFVNIVRRTSPT